MEYYGGVVHRLGVVQHGKVVYRAGSLDGIVGKGHVRGGQGLPVGEFHVIPDLDRPGEAIIADLDVGGQVVADGQIGVGHRERGLDQGLMDVLTGAPAVGGVEAGFGLGGGAHGNNHAVPAAGLRSGGGGRVSAAAARQHTGGQGQAQNQSQNSFHGWLPLVTGFSSLLPAPPPEAARLHGQGRQRPHTPVWHGKCRSPPPS